VVAGAVFDNNGRRLRGAKVRITAGPDSSGKEKTKTLTALTDARGEFAVRVPAAPMRYIVVVEAAGFREQQKEAMLGLEGRVDLDFLLEPAGG